MILHRLPTLIAQDVDDDLDAQNILQMQQPIIVAGCDRDEDAAFLDSPLGDFQIGHIIYCGGCPLVRHSIMEWAKEWHSHL